MTESWVQDLKHTSAPESVSTHEASTARRSRQRNIFDLLAQREISPRTKHQAKNQWTKAPRSDAGYNELEFWVTDAQHDLHYWAESQSLHCWCAKYCPLLPASRATIAAAFSPDGRVLASTHGDHTVKIIDCQIGKCLKVLQGHQRTPWVVRFHPLHSDILASGSLDCEVRLWDAKTSHCTRVLGFYRPIASIAFDATGELLAVASGHKLFIWDYNKRGEALDPPMILRTRRSLRAVQFHPHGAPYLLTAEVHNHDSEESTMTPALLNNYAFRDIPLLGSSGVDNLIGELPYTHNFGHVGASSSVPVNAGSFDGSRQHGAPHHQLMTSVPGVGGSLLGTHAVSFGVGSERATSLLDSGTELPCTVKLRIWRHDIKDPFIALEPGACLLTIPHVVLCSEMGTHFSPCGRFLVACVACVLPQRDGDHGSQLHEHYDSAGAGTSPTRHTLPSRQIVYELRVYSLEEAMFGTVLASRAVKAAHCLTSVQFSPTSEHILLAYGRHHNSLLKTILIDGETRVPSYRVLEVYRVSDMELVRVLPSVGDEVNVACFHPSPGAGLVYGTKEGKLRFLQNKMVQAWA
ncbi:hypothetical protein PAHAL_2G211300 [Panicum hallii]|uniref:Uncharacterized protein n=1 Tax=Panicum hallii TaxID=206008 RepID=A0A2S3GYL5_9POAL|nr:uncharacterized protein LOC112880674 [Panicum hallii]PAN11724.1 hypothetical protein PAHAL_2G211300 [Panicum hallii]